MPSYWETTPPSVIGAPIASPPVPELPNVPFAPTRGVQLGATVNIDKDFKVTGPWPPLWLGPNEVALLGTRHGKVALVAYYGEHFASSRILADTSTVGGARILDMAVSPDGKRMAIAAASADKFQVWIRDTHDSSPATGVASADQTCSKAGVAWLDPDTLAIGTECESSAAQPTPAASATPGPPFGAADIPVKPAHSLYVVQMGAQQAQTSLDLDCLAQIDPTTLSWSPDGLYALAQHIEEPKWSLIDRSKARCEPLKLPGLVPAGFIEWEKGDRRFLFTAAPARAPNPAHIGVMEYTLESHKARLLGSPAVAAAYTSGGTIAILGSNRLNAAVLARTPNLLVPAEIAWVDPQRSQLNIIPTGFSTTAAELLDASLRYSAARQMLVTSFQTPGRKGLFTLLLWVSAPLKNGGVLGTGRVGKRMLPSWSPDGTRLAILAGLPDHPTLAIIAAPP
ncbi:MAG: hypothetical protein ACLQU2_19360 [Candidatus Binataceae bacterium]